MTIPKEKIFSFYNRDLNPKEIVLKDNLKKISEKKIMAAKKIIKILSYFSTVEMIAITGSVAVGNAKEMDDIDLLIVTQKNTLWFTRPFVLLILSVFGRRRLPNSTYLQAANTFCPNLWLDDCSLLVPEDKQNLYTAHEVLQIMPILDRKQSYQRFLHTNNWVKKYLANAFYVKASIIKPDVPITVLSQFVETLFIPFNLLSFIFQYLYMKPKLTKEIVAYHSAYFHQVDFAQKLRAHLQINGVGYN
jgi:predicted nucleotidyltransferase